MTITYIHHSGYLLETEQALLLFDFVEGALPPLDPAKDLFVFVSHRHEDHFSPKIFDLAATHPASVLSFPMTSGRTRCRIICTDSPGSWIRERFWNGRKAAGFA